MTFFEAFRAMVVADGPLNGAINLLSPQNFPQATPANPLPATVCVVRLISGASQKGTLDGGASSWHLVRIEVTVYSSLIKTAESTIMKFRTKMGNFNGYLDGAAAGRFAIREFAGPRSIQDQQSRLPGIQLDILGLLDYSTLS